MSCSEIGSRDRRICSSALIWSLRALEALLVDLHRPGVQRNKSTSLWVTALLLQKISPRTTTHCRTFFNVHPMIERVAFCSQYKVIYPENSFSNNLCGTIFMTWQYGISCGLSQDCFIRSEVREERICDFFSHYAISHFPTM